MSGSDGKEIEMAEYIVELPHTTEDCLRGLDEMADKGKTALKEVVWGCPSGVHMGWALIKAKSEQEVRDEIGSPTLLAKARITEVRHFTPKDIEGFHKG
jgi:hypothetical protein